MSGTLWAILGSIPTLLGFFWLVDRQLQRQGRSGLSPGERREFDTMHTELAYLRQEMTKVKYVLRLFPGVGE